MCNLSTRTPVTYQPSLYTQGEGVVLAPLAEFTQRSPLMGEGGMGVKVLDGKLSATAHATLNNDFRRNDGAIQRSS